MEQSNGSAFPSTGKAGKDVFQSLAIIATIAAMQGAFTARAEIPDIVMTPWASGFEKPVHIVQPAGIENFYVVEQPGSIRVVPAAGGGVGALFVNLRDRVNHGDEKGLLSVAFHPKFKSNRRLFVNYTTGEDGKGKPRTLRTRISEFTASADFASCDPASEKIILEFDQPFSNHNGGQVAFGPDGFLYIGNGDGGSGNDPEGNGQKLDTLLGKMLRIDIDHRDGDRAYAIPNDNPLLNRPGARGEIWAYGLRNPWRWCFDRETGDLWCGDVGQNAWEEIDIIQKGKNYGWRIMEGFHCTPKVSPENCDQKGLELPVFEYPRSEGISVTGGHVYRGKKFPALRGIYLYADYGSRRVWGLQHVGGKAASNREVGMCPQQPGSFGEDNEDELFIVGHAGTIYRIAAK